MILIIEFLVVSLPVILIMIISNFIEGTSNKVKKYSAQKCQQTVKYSS